MTWDGEERRASLSARQINRSLAVVLVIVAALVFGGTAFVNGQRQADLLQIACGNAIGHRELTIAVQDASRITAAIAHDLGLPTAPIMVTVPELEEACRK